MRYKFIGDVNSHTSKPNKNKPSQKSETAYLFFYFLTSIFSSLGRIISSFAEKVV